MNAYTNYNASKAGIPVKPARPAPQVRNVRREIDANRALATTVKKG